MTDYVPFTPDEYAPDAPGTALHFQRWFENWIAGAEGAPGAPRIQPRAMVDFAGRNGGANPWTVNFNYPVSRIRAHGWASIGGSTAAILRMRASSDGGATFGGYSTLLSFSSDAPSDDAMFEVELNLPTGIFSCIYVGSVRGRNSGTMSVASDTNAIEFSIAGSGGQFFVTVYNIGTAT